MSRTCDLSVVIPCFLDAPHLTANVTEIQRVLSQTRLEWEVILVDDCSPDESGPLADRLAAADPERVRVLHHRQNTGRGRAVMDGLRMARGKVAGFVDIDLETPAHYLPAVVAPLLEGRADLGTVHRVYKLGWGVWLRAFLSKSYLRLVNAVYGTRFADTEAGYKFFRTDTMQPLLEQVEDAAWFWDTEIMLRSAAAGMRISVLPVLFVRRPDKKSTVRIFRDSLVYFRALWNFRTTWAALDRHPAVAAEGVISHS